MKIQSAFDDLGREALQCSGDAKVVAPKTTLSFQPGSSSNPIVAIFACPGRIEKTLGRPAAGTTGKNLCHLCDELRRIGGNDFDCYCKCRMTIANASANALWKSEHGRTIPNDKEIEDNVACLMERIRGKRVVLCFGSSARKACQMIRDKEKTFFTEKKVVEVCHLSSHGLKSVRPSDEDGRMHYDDCQTDSKLKTIGKYLYETLRDGVMYHTFDEFVKICTEG